MKKSKLIALQINTFTTNLSENKVNNTNMLKGGYHDGHTGCICTVQVSCELNQNQTKP